MTKFVFAALSAIGTLVILFISIGGQGTSEILIRLL
jgi:hypothetical protein